VEELTEGEPAAVAEENARRKAASVQGDLVLGADTVVALDGEILGKPRDAEQARAYLRRLGGRTHEVVGGVALASRDHPMRSFVEVTRVRFRAAGEELLDWYVGTGEWRGRAGGYAIQGAGAALVAAIEGDYLNVVGLPLARLLDEGFAAHLRR
jgi:septum formation protein